MLNDLDRSSEDFAAHQAALDAAAIREAEEAAADFKRLIVEFVCDAPVPIARRQELADHIIETCDEYVHLAGACEDTFWAHMKLEIK